MDKGVEEALDKVQVVSAAATKEWSLKNAMKKMEQEWQGKEFKVQENKETKTYTLGSVEEIQAILDDQLVKIQSMLASPYIKPLQAHAEEWADRLNTLQSIIDNQLTCQQTWQYLEPIFSSGDIMNQVSPPLLPVPAPARAAMRLPRPPRRSLRRSV